MTNAAPIDIGGLLGDPLAAVRDASRSVGYVGLDIPEDVLAAPTLAAAHLPWVRGRQTPFADRWLEDSFPGWARSMLEAWADGRFDAMEAVVFSRGDDTAQRLYYYVCELQRRGIIAGPRPLVFDTARIPRASSEGWTVDAVRRLAADLELDDDALRAGIAAANRRRDALLSADRDRASHGHRYEQLARASLFAPADRLAVAHDAAAVADGGRVLLAGSSPPDDGLHRAIESAGGDVIGEVCDRNLGRLGNRVDEQAEDPAAAIGAGAAGNRIGPRSFGDRAAAIVDEVARREADAVVYWLHEQDEALAWDVVSANRALADRDVPTLVLARRRWDLSDAPERDIGEFLGRVTA